MSSSDASARQLVHAGPVREPVIHAHVLALARPGPK